MFMSKLWSPQWNLKKVKNYYFCDQKACSVIEQAAIYAFKRFTVQLKNEPLLESRWCIFWCLQCGDRSQHFCGYSVSFLHLKNCNHGSQAQKQFDVVITVGSITNTFDLWDKLFKIFFFSKVSFLVYYYEYFIRPTLKRITLELKYNFFFTYFH